MADIWTIGHSSRPIDVFLDLLAGSGIEQVADVRRYAGSRAHPHFNPAALEESLARQSIRYTPFPELGGRRKPKPDSAHTVWRHTAFRGFADYMDTPEFERGLARLMQLAEMAPTAVMCSEAVWWRCHRSMIADALKARGWRVRHIMDRGQEAEHPFTSPARIVDGRLHYGSGESDGGGPTQA